MIITLTPTEASLLHAARVHAGRADRTVAGSTAVDDDQLALARDDVAGLHADMYAAEDPAADILRDALDALAGTLQNPPDRGVTYWIQTTLPTHDAAYAALADAHHLILAWRPLDEPDGEGGVGIAVDLLDDEHTCFTFEDLLEHHDDVTDFHTADP